MVSTLLLAALILALNALSRMILEEGAQLALLDDRCGMGAYRCDEPELPIPAPGGDAKGKGKGEGKGPGGAEHPKDFQTDCIEASPSSAPARGDPKTPKGSYPGPPKDPKPPPEPPKGPDPGELGESEGPEDPEEPPVRRIVWAPLFTSTLAEGKRLILKAR
ncbi:hypothetical protein F4809DRAFT_641502 [Biscogniauxia mediterranea]|nr:hypothetical protein F4809DRAFT_641502 [Biscogniauxia mediterranea]